MSVLADKVIFLTGGAAGIGRECVKAYLKAGAKVGVMDSDQIALNEIVKEFEGSDLLVCVGDVRLGNDVRMSIEKTIEAFGEINAIHNNAGIASPSKPIDETSEDEWDNLFSVNLKSVFWTTKFGINSLKKTKGCILNTSSIVGEMGQDNHAAYVATKGGMNGLTKAMALDYAPFEIRVNAVCPAGVWTPMLRKWAGEQSDPAQIENYLDNIHALGFCPEGDVIADVALFLISDAARFVTGCIMPVSGGAELGYKK
ncbi:SDR family NAD(P)-dependent oxidoreductase [Dyadobacter frigoris]|uniref:SDR family oxidoreductase n=1 Tax=Dyadobacter frigoris TaxID=2576211 RepID=A0A4U6D323_9BACT|nr:SDR family NAD(P)-dependent oxidoreductase [Dyadobacter frigoris]TKT90577.1 SDR family oxidoreductase [Dyadobacter frigoris]GLU51278.1 short-chain dehydrogenase [Dyadobacter frigoris]